GDAGDRGGLNIERLWMAHAEQHLFLRLELGRSINLQEDNELTLYLDTDNDPTTGRQTLGIGAELSWTFGNGRDGTRAGDSRFHEHTLADASRRAGRHLCGDTLLLDH
ncbi:hypothetical protein BRC21_00870, partial [Candidatus Saccharibacteria bacterium SW_7_54_9]